MNFKKIIKFTNIARSNNNFFKAKTLLNKNQIFKANIFE